ncbi:MAG: YvcK family protein [Erysipelotrichaceae bacterium]|nr:YvcK family protein [Erysipelotrichaceae bacterium]MCI9523843.1 YvcK family protein [Erysipelotrichaceae bacterium]
MKHIVVIGGGHGLSMIVRGLKHLKNIKLSAIVTVADDGGSTGRLRAQYQIPAMGDIRNVMCAMAESETLLSTLMNHRFAGGEEDVGGHNLGNLILTALTQNCGSFMEAVQSFSKVMKVKGDIIPSSTEVITLFATMEDGTIVRGESNIPSFDNRISRVFYQSDVQASEQALDAIRHADLIIYGIGSLYTSIMPNLIISKIREELSLSKAKKIYFCNAMTQPGETDGYMLEDHVQAIIDHTGPYAVDIVIHHNNEIRDDILMKYHDMGASEVGIRDVSHAYEIWNRDILAFDNDLIRHDGEKIKRVMEELVKEDKNA